MSPPGGVLGYMTRVRTSFIGRTDSEMPRALTPAALLCTLAFTAGCSGAKSHAVAGAGSDTGAKSTTGAATPSDKPTAKPFAGEKASDIFEQATKAAAKAKTVHILADLKDGKDRYVIDLRSTNDGK